MKVKKKIAVWCALFALLVALVPPGSASASVAYPFSDWCADNGYNTNTKYGVLNISDNDMLLVTESSTTGEVVLTLFEDVVKPDYYIMQDSYLSGYYGDKDIRYQVYVLNQSGDGSTGYYVSVYLWTGECWSLNRTGRVGFATTKDISKVAYNARFVVNDVGKIGGGVVTCRYLSHGMEASDGGYIEETSKFVADVGEALVPILRFITNFFEYSFVAFGYEISIGAIVLFSIMGGVLIAFIRR